LIGCEEEKLPMRRLQLEASLVVLWLLATGVFGYASDSKPARNGSGTESTEANKDKVFSRESIGFGATREDADLAALKEARKDIVKFFADQGVVLSWEPALEYISRTLVKNWSEQANTEVLPGQKLREVHLLVELSHSDYRKVLKQNREYVAQNRMLVLGKVLAGLVALLAAVAGYFRLEDATKGYYTAWLRLAALSFVAAVGAGLWLISYW
jgi:hypothetical protein